MHRPVNALDVSCEMPGLVVETKRVQFSSSVIWVFPKIGATPKSSILIGVFHYKPGYPYFLETPIYTLYYLPLFRVRTKMRNEVISLSSWLLFLVRGIYLTENPKK